MQPLTNVSLKNYNTFGIDVVASELYKIDSVKNLKQVLDKLKGQNLFILGGGSNMLLTKNITTPVLHIDTKGISTLYEDDTTIHLEVSAGENWHKFVLFCVANDYGGLENMSLIPGNVGTAPIQNIGAYGVELKDTFISCEAVNVQTQETRIFTKEDCQFGYRDSVFKTALKGQYIITSVIF